MVKLRRIDIVQEAEKFKLLGNEAYREKDFGKAMAHYKNAIELNPTNIAFYANMAAIYYEKKNVFRVYGLL